MHDIVIGWYKMGIISDDDLKVYVPTYITQEEYKELTGLDYEVI